MLNSGDKATLFANTFSAKYALIDSEMNTYSAVGAPSSTQTTFPEPTLEGAKAVLEALKVDSSTGPDSLPTRILKTCAEELALPLLMLANSILRTGTWPALWLINWIVPLYKKSSLYTASNYRGIRLTAQLSKAMGRFPGTLFSEYLLSSVSFGRTNLRTRRNVGRETLLLS